MKSLFNGLLCMSLLAFAVGCGKENSSGGGGSSSSNLGYSKYMSTSSKQVVDALNRWYNSRTEPTNIRGIIKVDKVELANTSTPPNQECDTIDLGLFDLPYCTYTISNPQDLNQGTVLSSKQLAIYPDNKIVRERNNAELKSFFTKGYGEVVHATSQGNKIYRVEVLKNNVVTTLIFDLNYHSLLNPVQVSSSADPSKIRFNRGSCTTPPFQNQCIGLPYIQ